MASRRNGEFTLFPSSSAAEGPSPARRHKACPVAPAGGNPAQCPARCLARAAWLGSTRRAAARPIPATPAPEVPTWKLRRLVPEARDDGRHPVLKQAPFRLFQFSRCWATIDHLAQLPAPGARSGAGSGPNGPHRSAQQPQSIGAEAARSRPLLLSFQQFSGATFGCQPPTVRPDPGRHR